MLLSHMLTFSLENTPLSVENTSQTVFMFFLHSGPYIAFLVLKVMFPVLHPVQPLSLHQSLKTTNCTATVSPRGLQSK